MRISKTYIKKIIKEEINKLILKEKEYSERGYLALARLFLMYYTHSLKKGILKLPPRELDRFSGNELSERFHYYNYIPYAKDINLINTLRKFGEGDERIKLALLPILEPSSVNSKNSSKVFAAAISFLGHVNDAIEKIDEIEEREKEKSNPEYAVKNRGTVDSDLAYADTVLPVGPVAKKTTNPTSNIRRGSSGRPGTGTKATANIVGSSPKPRATNLRKTLRMFEAMNPEQMTAMFDDIDKVIDLIDSRKQQIIQSGPNRTKDEIEKLIDNMISQFQNFKVAFSAHVSSRDEE